MTGPVREDTSPEAAARATAGQLLAVLGLRRWTLGVAESLTGGGVTSALVSVPGTSAVLRGGIVAYATDLKAGLLGVDAGLLADRGAVDPDVALRMAAGVRIATGADVGVSTTGVAGPEAQDGQTPGTVFVGVSAPGAEQVRRLELPGSRAEVIAGAVLGALELALATISDLSGPVAKG